MKRRSSFPRTKKLLWIPPREPSNDWIYAVSEQPSLWQPFVGALRKIKGQFCLCCVDSLHLFIPL